MNIFKKYNLLSVFSVIIVMQSCSSTNKQHLSMRHSFKSTQTNTFFFSMTWYVPPSVLFGNETQSIIANMGLKTRPTSRPVLNIDNETRLKLEDISIKRLENELVQVEMCTMGYKINSTKWLERSIELTGTCLEM